MFIRILPTTLLQIFCENLLYFNVIFKSMKIADDTFLGNSECKWVNPFVIVILFCYGFENGTGIKHLPFKISFLTHMLLVAIQNGAKKPVK